LTTSSHSGTTQAQWKTRARSFSVVLRSYSISEHQKIVKWLDHPGLGAHKPWVLMDQLNTLQPSSIVKVQRILFLRKMPAYINDMINLKDFQDLLALTDQCNEIWESRSQEPRPGRHCRRSSDSATALPGPATAGRPHPPLPQVAAAMATFSTTPSSAPAPRSAGTAAHTRKTSRPAVVTRTASAGPTHPC
jgi:hypothetical protein